MIGEETRSGVIEGNAEGAIARATEECILEGERGRVKRTDGEAMDRRRRRVRGDARTRERAIDVDERAGTRRRGVREIVSRDHR